jgi:predicted nuclease of predicted toxin-antitoxin system
MRILLDENVPVDFANLLAGHAVHTVQGLGWAGVKNGELLRRARDVCDVFVTMDRNLAFQQNIKALPFAVIVIRSLSNRMVHLTPLAEVVREVAGRVTAGTVERVGE